MASGQDARFADWQKGGFEPSALPASVALTNDVCAWLARAIQADRVRGVRALMYYQDRPAGLALAREYVTEEWVLELIRNKRKDALVLDLFVLLGEASLCRDLFMDHLIGRIAAGPHSQAFARVLHDRVPQDLISRTAHALAQLGFAEIQEDEQLLRQWTVATGYIRLLSDDEYKQLGARIGLVCERDLLARWLSDDAPVTHAPLPRRPAQFHSAASCWRWHYENIMHNHRDAAAGRAWQALQSRSADLLHWWTLVQHVKHETEEGASAVGPAAAESAAGPSAASSGRRLDVTTAAHAEDPQFQIQFRGSLQDPPDVLARLKAEAGTLDPIYGQSAGSARVGLRSDAEAVGVLARLEALEILRPSEIARYLYLYGADKATLDARHAASLAASTEAGASYDLVTFNADAPFEHVASLLVRIFSPSCRLSAARMESGRLGLYRRGSR